MATLLIGILTVFAGQAEAPAKPQLKCQSADGAVIAVIPNGFQSTPLERAETNGLQGSRWTDELTGSVIAAYHAPLPPERHNKPINMNELMKGFNDAAVMSMSGKLVQSSTDTINGFPTASMAVTSDMADLVLKQRVVVTSTMIYVVGATGTARAHNEDPRLQQFLDSLRVQPSAKVPPPFQPSQQPPAPNEWDRIGGQIGLFGVVLLVVCFAVSRQSQQKPRKKKLPSKKKKAVE